MNITKNSSKINDNFIISNNSNNLTSIISYHNHKNKSRNKIPNLFLTESNIKEKNNNIKTFFNTSNNIRKKVNLSLLYSKNSHRKPIKIKKDIYKKKLKELVNNLDNNEIINIFRNKNNLFEKTNYKVEKIPKVKTQEQLNYYLINAFSDNVPPRIEIKKSIKNRKIDEEYDIYKTIVKEKKIKKNEYLIKEYKRKNEIKRNPKIELGIENKRNSKKKLTGYRPVLFDNDNYKIHFKIKEKGYETILKESNKTQIETHKSLKSTLSHKISSKSSKVKNKSEDNKTNADKTKMNSLNYSFNKIHSHSSGIGKTNKIPNKSEELYKEHKEKYKKYLRKIRILRAQNYIEQIKKLEMEGNKLKKRRENNEWSNDKKLQLTELNEERFLLEIKRRNIFFDSFGIAGTNINDRDDDVDEDNFKGIKNYHLNLGMGATYMHNLKLKIEPRYILKEFKKKTIDKYKGNKGIYLGPNNKGIDRLKKLYKK